LLLIFNFLVFFSFQGIGSKFSGKENFYLLQNPSFLLNKRRKKIRGEKNLPKSLANNNPTKVHPQETERKLRHTSY
jgi:hypothetical protein